ncbi:hypothetical protein LR48_Vigan04g051800 [Vigna angularis]|uniref:BURP domain protein n=2 Tax=Phaseolus angularis TaxID=3914 RepID=A0A0L9UBK6_PHAAN|nr:BURP domain protein RD22 [Vigna angularis]KAG2399140.1 BURP domain protein [Vigna angularis]KOM40320.1 hypothetical protein LR48_Vigan04g051800 [Vigna angularis]BAT79545.1 hypothetical protein VIGAN_02245200 [Vigna angularis var. angularis]
MEFHWLPLLFSLNVILMTAQAALPPELYWQKMLPNTPIPKAIRDLPKLGTKDSFHDVEKIHSEDEIPPLSFYKGKKINSEDEIPPLSFYKVNKIHSEEDIPPLSFYKVKKIQSEEEIPPLSFRYVEKTQAEGEKIRLSQEGQMVSVANHQHYNPKTNPAFFEEQLRSDTELDIIFKKRKSERPLLPRQIAQRIPFASAKIKEIFHMLSMKPEVKNVKIVTETVGLCEAPSIRGVEKNCATSLESMVDFITSKLGKNAQVISTEAEKVSKSEKFLVKDGVKILAEENIIVCHPMNYPYVVFYCHKISNTTARFMPLEGEDGIRVKAVAVCHKDTSEWDPNHGFLQALKVKSGTVPVCHILPEGDLLWFAK